MATTTFHDYNGDGSDLTFNYTFPTYSQSEVVVEVSNVIVDNWTITGGWSATGTKEVKFDNTTGTLNTDVCAASGAPKAGTANVRIYRDTNVDSQKHTYQAGSALKAGEQNTEYTHLLRALQEEQTNTVTTSRIKDGAVTSAKIEDATIVNADISASAAIDFTKLENLDSAKILVGNGSNKATEVAVSGDVTIANTGAVTIASGAVETGMIANDAIDSQHYAADSIDSEHYAAGSVDGTAIANDAIDSQHYAANSIDTEHYAPNSIDTNAIADNTIDSSHYVDGSIDSEHIGNDQINSQHYAAGSVDLEHMSNNSVGSNQIINANIDSQHYVDASIDHQHLANDCIDGDNIQNDVINSEHYAEASIDDEHIATGAVLTSKIADDAVNGDKIADNSIDSEHYVDGSIDAAHIAANAVTTTQIADAELTTLAGMQSGTASILAGSTALTATLTEINTVVDGKGVQTTISDSDAHYPTSGAVIDYVTAQIAPIGGLEVIANDESFPETQPAAGVVISIADAGGLVVNGSGVSTTGDTISSDATVTINGINSAFHSKTVDAGVSFMVSSTGSGQVYDFHKATLKEADILSLSGDINDFAERYRVSADPDNLSDKDEGDLVYDTAADKMKVYDSTASAWKEVTSTGDFKYLFLCPDGGSGAPTLSNTSFDLREGSNSGSVASVTNAAQLIVSINGVIQKANTGTSAPSEGFAMADASNIKFSNAPGADASIFIVQVGSAVSIPTPGDNTVSTSKIQNLAVDTDQLAADAVEGSKIADDAVGSEHIEVLDANLQMADAVRLQIGTGNDLQLYHDASGGNHSYIMNSGAGVLKIGSDTQFLIGKTGNETYIECNPDGNVELFFDNSKKIETTTNGITVTGRIDAAADSTHDIGTSSVRFANGYFDTLYGDGSNLTGISGGVTSDDDNNTVGGADAGNAGTWDGATGNTCFGHDAGTDLTSGDNNVFVGNLAGESIQGGSRNIGIGAQSVRYGTGCSNNVGIGYNVFENTTGSNNIGIGGEDCATQITSGNSNIALGQQAMNHLKEGSYNISLGYYAAQGAYNATTSGQQYNISLGAEAGKGLTSGNNNYSIGKEAGKSISSGYHNVAIGLKAGDGITTGIDNIVVGQLAGNGISTGGYNICIGKESMGTGDTTASHNIAIGTNSMKASTTGTENIAIGLNSMLANTTGTNNIALGYYALAGNVIGAYNVAIGPYALEDFVADNASHGYNTAVGYGAAKNLSSATHGVYVGYLAGGTATITGDDDVCVGRESGNALTSGYRNVLVGTFAGVDITTGYQNTCVGYKAGDNIQTGFDNVYVGREITPGAEGEDGAVVIGAGLGSKGEYRAFIGGSSGAYNEQNYSTWSTTSDRRIKKNITNNTTGLDKINQITVRNFEYKKFKKDSDGIYLKDSDGKYIPETADDEITWSEFNGGDINSNSIIVKKPGIQVGAVAQELESVLPGLVDTDAKHGLKSVNTDNLIWYLVNAVKDLSTKNDALEARIATLEAG